MYTLRNAQMDIHERYPDEIQHEIALLQTGKANYVFLSQLSIIFEIPDDIKRVYESWKHDSDNYRNMRMSNASTHE